LRRRIDIAAVVDSFLDGSFSAGYLIDNLVIDSSVYRAYGFSRQIFAATTTVARESWSWIGKSAVIVFVIGEMPSGLVN
jgi:hypothetical protein